MAQTFLKFGESINGAFYFVLEKIISLQGYFIANAFAVARIVLLIALLSAGLNYALTGQNLKENLIKILKAFIFFVIIASAFPRVLGWVTNITFDLAYGAFGKDLDDYFSFKLKNMNIVVSEHVTSKDTVFIPLSRKILSSTENRRAIFGNLKNERTAQFKDGSFKYQSIAPAACIQVILLLAQEAFDAGLEKKEKFAH